MTTHNHWEEDKKLISFEMYSGIWHLHHSLVIHPDSHSGNISSMFCNYYLLKQLESNLYSINLVLKGHWPKLNRLSIYSLHLHTWQGTFNKIQAQHIGQNEKNHFLQSSFNVFKGTYSRVNIIIIIFIFQESCIENCFSEF